MNTRKKYSKEFKLDAISLILEQGYSRAEAARSLGVNANMLCQWIKEIEEDDGTAFRGSGKLTAEQAPRSEHCEKRCGASSWRKMC